MATNPKLDIIFARAQKMQKRSWSSYELCKSMLRDFTLKPAEYESAIRKIADIIRV